MTGSISDGIRQNATCSPIGQSLGFTMSMIMMIAVGKEIRSRAFSVTLTNQLLIDEYICILSGKPKSSKEASSASSMTYFIYAFWGFIDFSDISSEYSK